MKMAAMGSIFVHLLQLALQHTGGSGDPCIDEDSETGAEQFVSELMTRLTLTDAASQNRDEGTGNDRGSEHHVDLSHTLSDLSYIALQLNDAALSTHLLAVNIRNWFQYRSLR